MKDCFLNGPTPASYSFIFVFSNAHNKLYNKKVSEKMSSIIWCWDSNSWPLEHESPPIITRPGLRPIQVVVCSNPSDAYLLYGWLILALICWKNVWMLEKMENKQKEAGMAHVRRCWPDGLIIFSKFGYLQQWTFTQLHKNYQSGFKIVLPKTK